MHNNPATTRPFEKLPGEQRGISVQQRFELERAALLQPRRRVPGVSAGSARLGRLAGALAGLISRRREEADVVTAPPPARHLEGLEAAGYVILHDRRVSAVRKQIDYLVVGPSGIYVVVSRPWRGQVDVTGDRLYVDGRPRAGVPEEATRIAAAVHDVLSDELRPLGAQVLPLLRLTGADMPWQSWNVQGVIVTAGRGMARYIRHAPPALGEETVIRLALAADRLLEPASPANSG
jgi:hypothetical protein